MPARGAGAARALGPFGLALRARRSLCLRGRAAAGRHRVFEPVTHGAWYPSLPLALLSSALTEATGARNQEVATWTGGLQEVHSREQLPPWELFSLLPAFPSLGPAFQVAAWRRGPGHPAPEAETSRAFHLNRVNRSGYFPCVSCFLSVHHGTPRGPLPSNWSAVKHHKPRLPPPGEREWQCLGRGRGRGGSRGMRI